MHRFSCTTENRRSGSDRRLLHAPQRAIRVIVPRPGTPEFTPHPPPGLHPPTRSEIPMARVRSAMMRNFISFPLSFSFVDYLFDGVPADSRVPLTLRISSAMLSAVAASLAIEGNRYLLNSNGVPPSVGLAIIIARQRQHPKKTI